MRRVLSLVLVLLGAAGPLAGQTELMTRAYEQERRSDFNGANAADAARFVKGPCV